MHGKSELVRDGVDDIHNLAHVVLVVLPFLLLQEEIELYGDAVGAGLFLGDEVGHLLVHVVACRNSAFHITTEKRQVHLRSLQLRLLEITLINQFAAHLIVDDAYRMHIVGDTSANPAAAALLHALPVLERLVDKRFRRDGDDGVVEIAHLHGGECHILHHAVHPGLFHRNPVALAEHVVRGEMNARHESCDGILEYEHQYSRRGTQSGKERQRTTVEDDGHHHNRGQQHQDDFQHTRERAGILLHVATAPLTLVSLKGIDEAHHGTRGHHGDVDGREAFQDVEHHGILIENPRQQLPDDDGRHDMAGRDEHLAVEQLVVPLHFGLGREFGHQGHQQPAA